MNRSAFQRHLTVLMGNTRTESKLTVPEVVDYLSAIDEELAADAMTLRSILKISNGRVDCTVDDGTGQTLICHARLPDEPGAARSLYRIHRTLETANDSRFGEVLIRRFRRNPDPCYLVSTALITGKPIAEITPDEQTRWPLINILADVASDLMVLHDAGISHGDISPHNIIVDDLGTAHLVDLEYSLDDQIPATYFELAGTKGFIHPDLRPTAVRHAEGDDRPPLSTRVTWDLYALGRTLLVLIDTYRCIGGKQSETYNYRFIRLLASRLLDGHNSKEDTILNVPLGWYPQIAVRTSGEALSHLLDLRDDRFPLDAIPELNALSHDQIAASTHVRTVQSPRLDGLLRSREFGRLSVIQQLGLISTVFPTATHTRQVHALGVYSLVCEYLRWSITDPTNPFLRQIASASDLRATMVAALLHDIGHFPLAHDLEEAAPSVFDHEKTTASMLEAPSSQLREAVEGPEPNGWGLEMTDIVRILDPGDSILHRLLQSFISGPLDADKLDYLTRDSAILGVHFGQGIDARFLMSQLTVIISPADDQRSCYIGTSEKGSTAAAAVADARYRMYARVYWHHTYREVKAMIQAMTSAALMSMAESITQRKAKVLPGNYSRLRSDILDPSILPTANLLAAERALAEAVSSYVGLAGDADGRLISRDSLPLPPSTHQWELRPEHQILIAIAAEGGDEAQRFCQMLVSRDYYKRIHSLSPGRSLDEALISSLIRIGAMDARVWLRRFALSTSYQRHIVERLTDIRQPEVRTTSFFTPNDRDRFLAAAQDHLVLLVDFPNMSRGPTKQLYFLQEQSKIRARTSPTATLDYLQSMDYERTAESFRDLAKVRIMAAPEFAPLVRSYLADESLEEALRLAVNETAARVKR